MDLPAFASSLPTPAPASFQAPLFRSPAVGVYHAVSGIVLVDQRPDGYSEPASPCLGDAGELVFVGQSVAIHDEAGQLIGSGTLGSGIASMSGNCGFVFAVNGVPEVAEYIIYVGGINVSGLGISLDAMRASAWDLGFDLRYLGNAAPG